MDVPGLESRQGQHNFLFSNTYRPIQGPTQLPSHVVSGFIPRVRRPGREVDHSLPSSAVVKNEWHYRCTPICSLFLVLHMLRLPILVKAGGAYCGHSA